MSPKCTLSALTVENRGQSDPQLLIYQTERKHFVRLTKTQLSTQEGVRRSKMYIGAHREAQDNNEGSFSQECQINRQFTF